MNHISILLAEPLSTSNLHPFSIMHCSWELRCGASRLFEKYERYFPLCSLHYIGRKNHLQSFIARQKKQSNTTSQNLPLYEAEILIIVSGNLLLNAELAGTLLTAAKQSDKNICFRNDAGNIAGAILKGENALHCAKQMLDNDGDRYFEEIIETVSKYCSEIIETSAVTLNYLWDALAQNGRAIAEDVKVLENIPPFHSDSTKSIYGINETAIYVAENVEISPGVILDASEGPIIISEKARIMANSVIVGPCAIGQNSLVKIGAKIYGETSFGDYCKIGGEVENSIVQGYSNKQHDGFLGHSYLGEWVNLGADTNTSDLKNTYSPIIVRLAGKRVPTGRIMLGLLCGDHTKSGINTMFATGTVAGVSSSVLGPDYAPSVIPSFSFGGASDSPRYQIDRALDVARTVMKRRAKELQPEEELLLRAEYETINT